MKICNKCGHQYSDEYSFCGKCGIPLTNLVEVRVCPSCKRNFGNQQVSFCPYCGVGLVNQIQNSTIVTPKINYNSVSNTRLENTIESKKEHSFFSRENLFTADGRRGRLKYFLVNAFWGAIFGALSPLFNSMVRDPAVYLVLFVIYCGVYSYATYFNAAKRLHDLDKPSSWAVFLVTVPLLVSIFNQSYGLVIGFLFNIYPQFFKGTEGPNQYGEDPLQET